MKKELIQLAHGGSIGFRVEQQFPGYEDLELHKVQVEYADGTTKYREELYGRPIRSSDVTVAVTGVSSKGVAKENVEGDLEANTEYLNDR